MRKIYSIIIAVNLIVTSIGLIANAQELAVERYSARVKIVADGDENIKGQVSSFIKREFRSLVDVIIVEDNADWEISMVTMKLHTIDGHERGVSFSVIILKPFDNFSLLTTIELMATHDSAGREIVNAIDVITSDLYYYWGHWLRSGAVEDIKKISEGIVADFDNEFLEPERVKYRRKLEKGNGK
jgi:hypothetical protein